MSDKTLPTWMALFYDALDLHLKTFDSPEFELLPHPKTDLEKGRCGAHEASQSHCHIFCLFICCGKTILQHSLPLLKTSFECENRTRFKLARLALLLQPEDYCAWNVLKSEKNHNTRVVTVCKVDLKFPYFLLTKHPRSAETFCHLRFLLRHLADDLTDDFRSTAEEALRKCNAAADNHHGNYHAWDHRRYVVTLLLDSKDKGRNSLSALMQSEFDQVRLWQASHISDFCPFKYRVDLIKLCRSNQIQLNFCLSDELGDLNKLMRVYTGHETLWQHRKDLRALANEIQDSDYESFLTKEKSFLDHFSANSQDDWELTLYDRYSLNDIKSA